MSNETVNPQDAWAFETKQIHAGQTPDAATGARALPIYQTTSFVFEDAAQAAGRFALAEAGPIYTRITNPTQEAVETRIAALEGGVGGLLVASGQAAETLAILNIAEAGDHVVASPNLYGGTYNLLQNTLSKYGITTTFVENPRRPGVLARRRPAEHQAVLRRDDRQPQGRGPRHRGRRRRRARDRRPAGRGQHHRHALPHPPARARRRHRRPLRDEVPRRARHLHRGRHRRRRHLRLVRGPGEVPELQHPGPELQRPGLQGPRRPGVHPQGARAAAARPRPGRLPVQRLPHRPGPGDAVAAHRAPRGQRPAGRRVPRGPGAGHAGSPTPRLPSSPWYDRAQKYAPRAPAPSSPSSCAGGYAAGLAFVDALKLHSNVANIGDVRSLVIHPASTTHSQLSPEDLAAAGVNPGLVRLAVGIENIDDILADLELGLAAAASFTAETTTAGA